MSNLVKHQTLSTTFENSDQMKQQESICQNFDDLPDEIQLKIFNHLGIKDLIRCGQVSKRTRRICCDVSEWRKINLSKKIVPAEFVKYVLDHGCQYLNLGSAKIMGTLSLYRKTYEMKYLNLADCNADPSVIKEIIASCHSIQKLSLRKLEVFYEASRNILSYVNPQGLQTLDLTSVNGLDLQYLKEILKSKTLTEISLLSNKDLSESQDLVEYIVNNLPSNMRKISFGGLNCITDEHITTMKQNNENLTINQFEFRGCLGKIDPNYSIKPENGLWDVQIGQLELFSNMPDKPFSHWHIC